MSSSRTHEPRVAGIEGSADGLAAGATDAEGLADALAAGATEAGGVAGPGGVGLGVGEAHAARRTVPARSEVSLPLIIASSSSAFRCP
jgi:hypothetical protein